VNRRNFVTSAGLAIPAALSTNLNPLFAQTAADKGASTGRLKHGITTQALLGGDSRSVEDRCKLAASLGIKSAPERLDGACGLIGSRIGPQSLNDGSDDLDQIAGHECDATCEDQLVAEYWTQADRVRPSR